jgi:hypothetical protein
MGTLIWQTDRWYIDGTDEVRVGDVIEIREQGGDWEAIEVAQEHSGLFYSVVGGRMLDRRWEARRPAAET